MKLNGIPSLIFTISLAHYVFSAAADSPLVDLGYTGVQGIRNASNG